VSDNDTTSPAVSAPAPSPSGRGGLRTLGALRVGLLRPFRWPLLLAGLWLVGVLIALPATWIVADAIETSVGSSLVHEDLRRGFDTGWFGEFQHDSTGLARTFAPTVTGAGAFYGNLEGWLTGGLFRRFPGLVALGTAYAIVWAFLLGGVIERFADPRGKHSARRLLQSGGAFFFRFLRLALLSGALYFLVYLFKYHLMEWLAEAQRDLTSERVALLGSLLAYAVVALLLVLVHVIFAYAKIAIVTEERRSVLVAAFRGLGFVVFHPLRAFGLYFAVAVLSAVLLLLWSLVAPGVGQSSTTAVLLAFIASQVFLVVRLGLRLGLLAGEVELYRSVMGDSEPS
jgi:hypothetical protein